jgi:eukaryotic-like serine/threonine-protein kinase
VCRARVAVHRHEGDGGDIWFLEPARGTRQRFTFEGSQDNNAPVWSPKGDAIAFASRRDNGWELLLKRADSGQEQRILQVQSPAIPVSWSPDGQFLMYMMVDPKTGGDLFVVPLAGDRKPFPFAQAPFNEAFGQISPDGRWAAYQSTETGRAEIYVRPFPSGPGKWTISTSGGVQPRWRSDGRELFYLTTGAEGQLMSVDVKPTGTTFTASVPKALFVSRGQPPRGNANIPYLSYAVSPDGERFLLARPVEAGADDGPAAITVVLNWIEALDRRPPT